MRYNVGDIIVKQSMVFGRQFVRVTGKTRNLARRGSPGFNGVACDKDGKEIRKDDPYGNKVWGFDREVLSVHHPDTATDKDK